jgi:RimJ/RimL family protein N-acetyltransferase
MTIEKIYLQGPRVRLRAVEPSDLESIMEWVGDQEITGYLSGFINPVSKEMEREWVEQASRDPGRPLHDLRLVIETNDGLYLGNIALHDINWRSRNAEVGILIGKKEYLGKGYGTEAMLLMLEHGFERLNLHRIILRVFDFNQRAIKSYEKCGFKKEGVLREDFFARGKYRDEIIMGILRREFLALEVRKNPKLLGG